MRILIINGSPRGKNGNTHWMVREVMAGAQEAGAEVENIFLAQKTIKMCMGCFACWTKTPGQCLQKDDTGEILEKLIPADILVFATPVYVDNVTGLMKNFMDRMIPLVDPHFEKDPGGEYRHRRRFEKLPKLAVLANSGLPEQTHFQVLRLLFRRMARNMQSELVAEIYRGEGELLSIDSLLVKPFLARYRNLLRLAGRELGELGRLSASTCAALEKPLVPKDIYMRGANKQWDKDLAKLPAAAPKQESLK